MEQRLNKLCSSAEDDLDFITKAFPVVLDELLHEAQEEKVDVIINGFENNLSSNLKEENKVLVYYDILRDLRVDEIKRLHEFTEEYAKLRNEGIYNGTYTWEINLPPDDREARKKYNENDRCKIYITI
ncbi:hypothetical protein [Paenibacillus assamensis]|uniref:hypothetical protein n=1 Tax=Paenibacillus assamensis TaxID=311244 RepID=UPI0012F9A66A|nr:hypothetical protein [Paenibacillus assamensis]